MRRLFAWFGRIIGYFFPPLLGHQLDLEERCAKIGTLLLQQIEGAEGLYWMAQLRAFPSSDQPHRYAWTAQGDHVHEALEAVLAQAKDWKIGERPIYIGQAKTGGAEYDDPHVRVVKKLEPPSWD